MYKCVFLYNINKIILTDAESETVAYITTATGAASIEALNRINHFRAYLLSLRKCSFKLNSICRSVVERRAPER